MTAPAQAQLSILKEPGPAQSRVALFSIVRNEMYFLPHFLRHYRSLGVREFWLLDDRSSDGTRELLMAQPDCGVIASGLAYGDPCGDVRFGVAAKTLVPNQLLQGRWVLSVDADEFLVLPRAHASLDSLVDAMESEGLGVARALMLDFFPGMLRPLDGASTADDPFALCPWFDAWQAVDWPDRSHPSNKVILDGVRTRMLARLLETAPEVRSQLKSYRFPVPFKVPLLFWEADTQMLSAHRANVLSSDRVQLALAHFKFYPGYRDRIADALRTNAYWQDSTEYRFLDLAVRALADWPLPGPRSRRFRSAEDLEQAGLLFSRLGAAPA